MLLWKPATDKVRCRLLSHSISVARVMSVSVNVDVRSKMLNQLMRNRNLSRACSATSNSVRSMGVVEILAELG
jgi:hypothetical protein